MPRFHPCPGKGGVVDQANVLEPAQHLIRGLVRDAALAQRFGELGARPGREREQPQAHLPRPLPRIVTRGRRPPTTVLRIVVGIARPALVVSHKGGGLVLPHFAQPAAPAGTGAAGTGVAGGSLCRCGPTPSLSFRFFSCSLLMSGLFSLTFGRVP